MTTTRPAPDDPEWVAHVQGSLALPKNARLRHVGGALLVVPGRSVHFRNRCVLADWAATIPNVRPGGRFALTPAINGFTPEPEFAPITTGDSGEPIPVEVAGEPYPIDPGQFRWIGP